MARRRETLGGARLSADAKNRAWRSLLIGLVIDLSVAISLGLVAAFDNANGWGDLQWGLVTFAVGKSLVQALGSFILRRVLDPSSIPTPLPPADPGPPADDSEVPPVTAVDEEAADAEAEAVQPRSTPRKRPAKKAPAKSVSPDEQTRRMQAEIDLAQARAATPTRPERVAKKVAERKQKGTK